MIPLFKVKAPEKIGNVIQEVFDTGMITEGEYTERFEKEFGKFIGNPNVVMVNSCTSAITLAAYMCDLGPGDEVITSPMTCMAGNEPFYHTGATLVFADIEIDTGNINIDDVLKKITSKTKAISAVHWGGNPFDIVRLEKAIEGLGIKIIDDAAHALGTTIFHQVREDHPANYYMIGNFGDYTCFSFQAVKHLTTVDGGAIVCKSAEDAERLRKLRWFGLDRGFKAPPGQPPASRWEQDIAEAGFKMHMSNVTAAIGLEQLKRVDEEVVLKHMLNGHFYDEHINNPHVVKLHSNKHGTSAYWIYSVLVEDPTKFKNYLKDNGIACDVVHVRNDQYSVFEQFRTSLPGVDFFCKRMMNIPVGWWLTPEEVKHIVKIVNAYGG